MQEQSIREEGNRDLFNGSFTRHGIEYIENPLDLSIFRQTYPESVLHYLLPKLNLLFLIIPEGSDHSSVTEAFSTYHEDLIGQLNIDEKVSNRLKYSVYCGNPAGELFELKTDGKLEKDIYFYRCGECTSYGFQNYGSGWLCRICLSGFSEAGRILAWRPKSDIA
tara:strand:+ start:659 stop:1153 length:495 start_codon:yes stop_codon:yes gene_type:complete